MVDLIGILLHDADLLNCPRQYAKEQWNYNPEMSWDLLSKVIWSQWKLNTNKPPEARENPCNQVMTGVRVI